MNTPTRTRIITAAGALTLTAAGLLFAGPLDPPAGPVTSTYKTLTEVEPRIAINLTNTPGDADSLFKITQRGSYYLTGNITGVVGKHGIEIAASGVTLDLMGFDLVGIPGMGAFDGVSATVNSLTNITIRNGSVRGWGDEGVDLETLGPINSAVIDVRASGNTGNGIWASFGSTISGCSTFQNSGNGIVVGPGSTLTGCTAYLNTGNGIFADASTVVGCTAVFNAGGGIFAEGGSTVTGCTAQQNSVRGIFVAAGSTVTGCTALGNSGDGIYAGEGSTVTGCTASSNTGDGIEVSSNCRVTDNTCAFNGNGGNGSGIFASGGSDNRIEGNNCTGADRGINVDTAGNIIIRNTCSGNSIDWVIAANNVCGPILDRRAPASAAISGFTAPDSTGSTHPNANFSY